MLYVFGHKNPDTDAILSSMLYAKFLSYGGVEAKAVRLGALNNETILVLNLLGWTAPDLVETLPAGSLVVLTDHNEKSQTIDNIDELEIVSLIDHHKFNLQTKAPLEIIAKPLASTCSLIYSIWASTSVPMSQDIARAMMMGIISDTLYFRSPTTTPIDKEYFTDLQKVAMIDNPEQLSLDMFAAKSDLGDISVRELITLDYKVFESNGKKFGRGAAETTNPGYILGRKDEIVKDLLALKQEDGLDFILLSVVDILNEHNITIVPSADEAAVVLSVFGTETSNQTTDLGNRISRKKQLAPFMADYLSKI